MNEDLPVARKLLLAAALLIVVVLAPTGIAWLTSGLNGAYGALVGAIYGLLLAVRAGWRHGLWMVPGLLVAAGLGIATSGTWAWVGLLGLIGAAAGWAGRHGWMTPVALLGLVVAVEKPADGTGELIIRALYAGISALLAIAVTRRIGLPAVNPGFRMQPRDSNVVAVVLGLIATAAAALGLVSGSAYSQWLPMTVFLLVIPSPGLRISQYARHRVLGTAIGVLVGGLVTAIGFPAPMTVGVALLFLLGSIAYTEPTWFSAALSSTALVLILGQGDSATAVAETRILATIAGAALVLIGTGIVVWWSRRHPAGTGESQLAAALVAQTTT